MLHHEKGLTFCQSLFVTVEVDKRFYVFDSLCNFLYNYSRRQI